MIHIISKKDGPRREDVVAKRMIKENRSTIEALANQFSGGTYSKMRQPPKPKEPEELVRRHYGSTNKETKSDHPAYIRVSLNGRVVVVDGDTSKQLHFLGEIRFLDDAQAFVLATKENKFFSPMESELSMKLADFDHKPITADFTEEDLVSELKEKLGLR